MALDRGAYRLHPDRLARAPRIRPRRLLSSVDTESGWKGVTQCRKEKRGFFGKSAAASRLLNARDLSNYFVAGDVNRTESFRILDIVQRVFIKHIEVGPLSRRQSADSGQ